MIETVGIIVGIVTGFVGIATGLIAIATVFFKGGKVISNIEANQRAITQFADDLKTTKKEVSDESEKRYDKLEKSIDKLRDGVSDLTSSVSNIHGMLGNTLENKTRSSLSERNSPIKLNDEGERVLSESGVDGIVDYHFDTIVKMVKQKKPANAYQVQEATFSATREVLESTEELVDKIEQAAFMTGCTPRDVMFVGGLYVRDRVLKKLDCLPGDIDKHDPQVDTPKPKKNK